MALLALSRSTGIMGTGIDPFGNDLGMFRFLVFTCASIMLDYLRLASFGMQMPKPNPELSLLEKNTLQPGEAQVEIFEVQLQHLFFVALHK